MHKLLLLYNTIKHLKPIQIRYQLWYRLKRFFHKKDRKSPKYSKKSKFTWTNYIHTHKSYQNAYTFKFLNVKHNFSNNIDWNYSGYGKLWTYNLNYFDYLNQQKISKEEGLTLIKTFVKEYKLLEDAKEPYPTSLRVINWIKFITLHKIEDQEIDLFLSYDIQRLSCNLEYHLLANHLLENAFALFFGSHYFGNLKLLDKATLLLKEQLNEQILQDGSHYECSPMYHQLMLFRILDCIQLVKNSPLPYYNIDNILRKVASNMLGWLNQITFSNGDIPLVNDSAFGINPTTKSLNYYAHKLGLKKENKFPVDDSTYRMIRQNNIELMIDVGNIQSDYQPGHAHADTFNFIIYYNSTPFIIDTGTSTYENNQYRKYERSTAAHNTVMVEDSDSSQVWSSFRVAARSEVINIVEKEKTLSATQKTYKGFIHSRSWSWRNNAVEIIDTVQQKINAKAYLHLDTNVKILNHNLNKITTSLGSIECQNASTIDILDSWISPEFNKRINSKVICITFENELTTILSFG